MAGSTENPVAGAAIHVVPLLLSRRANANAHHNTEVQFHHGAMLAGQCRVVIAIAIATCMYMIFGRASHGFESLYTWIDA